MRTTFLALLQRDRKLKHGNPNEGNIGADYWRLGLDLWKHARLQSARARQHRLWLKRLNLWRNAVAHQDFNFDPSTLPMIKRAQPLLGDARNCHRSCDYLATTVDSIVGSFLTPLLPAAPW